jgi:hypothetical protein
MQIHKSKKRNIKGRKGPQFAHAISIMYADSLVTMDEMMENSPTKTFDQDKGRMVARYDQMPENSIVVESLGGHTVIHEQRLFRHLDRIALALTEFGDEFRSETGASVHALRVDKKNRVWGNDVAVLGLAYLAIAAGLAEWTQPRSEWENNEDKMPRLRFIKQEEENEQEKHEQGIAKFHQDGPVA